MGAVKQEERLVEEIRQGGGQPRGLVGRRSFKTTVGRHLRGSLASCSSAGLTRRRVPRELRVASDLSGSVLSCD